MNEEGRSMDWSLNLKHEIGFGLFIEGVIDEVGRKITSHLKEYGKRMGVSDAQMIMFGREVIYEVAANLVNMGDRKLTNMGISVESLFPKKPAEKTQ